MDSILQGSWNKQLIRSLRRMKCPSGNSLIIIAVRRTARNGPTFGVAAAMTEVRSAERRISSHTKAQKWYTRSRKRVGVAFSLVVLCEEDLSFGLDDKEGLGDGVACGEEFLLSFVERNGLNREEDAAVLAADEVEVEFVLDELELRWHFCGWGAAHREKRPPQKAAATIRPRDAGATGSIHRSWREINGKVKGGERKFDVCQFGTDTAGGYFY